MLDVEDFDVVFEGLVYDASIAQKIRGYRQALGGQTFFERLLNLLKIDAWNLYPPEFPHQLHDLHQRIVSSNTTLHNKHCLIFYLLKDLSPIHDEVTELSLSFARSVHLEQRFCIFIEGLWALDHLDFSIAVSNLTHPSIIPTFPDEIMLALLKGRAHLGGAEFQSNTPDDILPLAYYDCVKPPLRNLEVRTEFAKYLAGRSITETYFWIRKRPEHERQSLLTTLVEQTLKSPLSGNLDNVYPRKERAMEFVNLPFSGEEEEFIEKFLIHGRGATLHGAQDMVTMRRIAIGKLEDVVKNTNAPSRSPNIDGLNWDVLKDGIERGMGSQKDKP